MNYILKSQLDFLLGQPLIIVIIDQGELQQPAWILILNCTKLKRMFVLWLEQSRDFAALNKVKLGLNVQTLLSKWTILAILHPPQKKSDLHCNYVNSSRSLTSIQLLYNVINRDPTTLGFLNWIVSYTIESNHGGSKSFHPYCMFKC